ncbi:MAG TPA: hypothetical protein VK890_09225, partial [Bacteroidia bacterium]|nr:hypothetical protein [Bacteroidia bacterium]
MRTIFNSCMTNVTCMVGRTPGLFSWTPGRQVMHRCGGQTGGKIAIPCLSSSSCDPSGWRQAMFSA